MADAVSKQDEIPCLQPLKIIGYTDSAFKKSRGKSYLTMLDINSLIRERVIDTTKLKTEKISFNIIIDCTGVVDKLRTDLTAEIAALKKICYDYNGTIHRPNFVKIEWGKNLIFKGVLTSFDINYTLFEPDGSPQKAKIALTFSTYTDKKADAAIQSGIPVNNAGLVLLSGYFTTLFDRLKLIDKSQTLAPPEAQFNAIQYLQFLATGSAKAEETMLVLNKILCGVPLAIPVKSTLEISDSDKELINGLIKAAISNWAKIGQTSIDGFRSSWLIRDGILFEYSDKWELTIEKRGYDVLLQTCPFSFSLIKYPWMEKPLHVLWL